MWERCHVAELTDAIGDGLRYVSGQRDYVLYLLMAAAAFLGGFTMERWGQLFGRAAQSVMALGLFSFIVRGFMREDSLTAKGWDRHGTDLINTLSRLQFEDLVGVYVYLLGAVAAVFAIKSVLRRA